MLDNRYALLLIRGERPVMDQKYDILRHPHLKGTTDGSAAPYLHGEDTRSIASVRLALEPSEPGAAEPMEEELDYVLLTEEELEEWIRNKSGGKTT